MDTAALKQQGATLRDTDFSNFPVYIPDTLKFKPTKAGLAARRIPVKWRSEQQTYTTTGNRLIRIILPNNALYDPRSGYLTFTLSLKTTGGTYRRLHDGVFTIFNRLRVIVGSVECENIIDYGNLYAKLWAMTNPPQTTSNIGEDMGFGTQAQRNTKGANVSTNYACPIWSGVLNTELLPFDNLKTGMVLEFYLDDPVAFVETDGTMPIVEVSNVVFHIERLELDPSYRAFISNFIMSNGLQLGFHSWERNISSLTTGTQQNITINQKSSSVNGILNFFTLSTSVNDTTINDKYLTWLPLGLSQFNAIINGTQYPDEPIDITASNGFEAYQMYARWIKKWKLNGFLVDGPPPINKHAFINQRFVFIIDLEPYPEVDDIINPFSTLNNQANLIIKLVFANQIPPNYQLDSWVESFRRITIACNGSVSVLQ